MCYDSCKYWNRFIDVCEKDQETICEAELTECEECGERTTEHEECLCESELNFE